MQQRHNIEPVYDQRSRVLILGSFPSVKSREAEFFYAHPQNRFWRVLAAVFEAEVPVTVAQKKRFLLQNGIALWDVCAVCSIEGSADSTIRDAVPNDVARILSQASIERIFVNGKTAAALYKKLLQPVLLRPAVCLPSTSPANAAVSPDQLIEAWQCVRG